MSHGNFHTAEPQCTSSTTQHSTYIDPKIQGPENSYRVLLSQTKHSIRTDIDLLFEVVTWSCVLFFMMLKQYFIQINCVGITIINTSEFFYLSIKTKMLKIIGRNHLRRLTHHLNMKQESISIFRLRQLILSVTLLHFY